MNEDPASLACARNGATNGCLAPDSIREIGNHVFARGAPASLSPSLGNDHDVPAFELKFQLHEEQARQVAEWARQHLNLDPHALPELGNAYRVHGLYLDTSALDVFHRSPGYKRKKYRLRRYGSNAMLFLEQKRKSGGRVAKRRIEVEEAELDRLREIPTDLDWPGGWFHRRLSARKLQPSCFISYQRQAYFGQNPEGPLRLTLDRNLYSRNAERWTVEEVIDGMAMLPDRVLLELKYRRNLPAVFKALMQDVGLTPSPVSKYRLAIHALGRAAIAGGSADVCEG
jgi:VTC domain